MPRPLTICAVTGSRADYGLLFYPIRRIAADPALRLRLVVTGQHLDPAYGMTVDQIENDGFAIDARVPIDLKTNTPQAVARAMGQGVQGFADCLPQIAPDWLLVLGDRYEIFAAVQAALILQIPVAHIAGGDVTVGAFDDAIRHSITKMAHLHFATSEEAARRIRQLGEADERVFAVGNPALDYLTDIELLDRAALDAALGVELPERFLVVTFHPVTLARDGSMGELDALLDALADLPPSMGLVFTKANSDPEGACINERITRFTAGRPQAYVFDSLGAQRYWSLLAAADAVVGNSSSGLYEAPSLKTPTVNIGDRQRGRLCADSVVSCAADTDAISLAIRQAMALDCRQTINPYGDGHAAPRILETLKTFSDPRSLLKKEFVDRL